MQNSADHPQTSPAKNTLDERSFLSRAVRVLRPSHQHTAFSATLLVMTAVMLSRVFGFLREAYIAWAFGATRLTDAYIDGFTLPDLLNYLVAGGTVSITFIAIYTRFLAEEKDDEAQKTFSVIITVMTTVLVIGVILAAIFAPQLDGWYFGGKNGLDAEKLAICVRLTRILLPAQLFFYIGGVVSAVLYSRRLFFLPAFGPLVYNVAIILSGVLFRSRIGIESLAYGAVAGSFLGIFLINAIGAARAGARYRLSFDVHNPAFREWVRLSIPLMLGVSLVSADDWILRYFAKHFVGDTTRLTYAKRLFAVPISVLGQAAGQASLPFFARLIGEKRMPEFSDTVNGSVYRITSASLLLGSFMMSAALPLVDLLYRRGLFLFSDAQETAAYFFVFSISLAFWSAQALYARGFYASGDTLTPMIASTIITVVSIPLYAALLHKFSTVGLAVASDLGIAANCLAMALLLHRRKLVSFIQLQWKEIGKAALTALGAGLLSYEMVRATMVNNSRLGDVKALGLGGITWAAAVAAGLWLTKSSLPGDLRRRKLPASPNLAENQAVELTKGAEP
jgi:putative peptidoglycan lipid II flippase